MIETAGGILLALGFLAAVLVVMANFRVLGFLLCGLGLVVLVALQMGG